MYFIILIIVIIILLYFYKPDVFTLEWWQTLLYENSLPTLDSNNKVTKLKYGENEIEQGTLTIPANTVVKIDNVIYTEGKHKISEAKTANVSKLEIGNIAKFYSESNFKGKMISVDSGKYKLGFVPLSMKVSKGLVSFDDKRMLGAKAYPNIKYGNMVSVKSN